MLMCGIFIHCEGSARLAGALCSCTLASAREDKLALHLSIRVEVEVDAAAAQQTLEQQVGNAVVFSD